MSETIDSPFDPAIWKKAGEIADGYSVVIESDGAGGFIGHGTVNHNFDELSNAYGDGATRKACEASIRESLQAIVASILLQGWSPP